MTESTSEDNSGAYRRRTNAYSFLVGRQLYNGRTIKVELLAGGTVLTMAVRPIRVNPGWESLQNESDNWVAPSIGVEVPLSLTRRLGIVPGFRWHWSLIPYLVAYPHSEAHDVSRFRLAIRWQP